MRAARSQRRRVRKYFAISYRAAPLGAAAGPGGQHYSIYGRYDGRRFLPRGRHRQFCFLMPAVLTMLTRCQHTFSRPAAISMRAEPLGISGHRGDGYIIRAIFAHTLLTTGRAIFTG